jgi:16S rRNA (cytidine1402-2'-O)-methyltransferase
MSTVSFEKSHGSLYVVATPIGNLEDMTYRAVRVLGEVNVIFAEDTRHSRKLMNHYGLEKPLISYHDHNERQRTEEILKRLSLGEHVALISDAGTPAISDPGYRIISSCRDHNIRVVPIPGPSALVTALSASGVAVDRFAFEGYLPARSNARLQKLKQLNGEKRTLVFYETPHRLINALRDMIKVFGKEQRIVVAREMTKRHEEFFRGSLQEVFDDFSIRAVKGEFVLIVPPEQSGPQQTAREALRVLLEDKNLSRRDAVKIVAKEYGVPVSDVYRESLQLEDEK